MRPSCGYLKSHLFQHTIKCKSAIKAIGMMDLYTLSYFAAEMYGKGKRLRFVCTLLETNLLEIIRLWQGILMVSLTKSCEANLYNYWPSLPICRSFGFGKH